MISAIHAEWIGKRVHILAATNPTLVGLAGIVIDETKNLVVLETEKGIKRVPKKGTTFSIVLNEGSQVVSGDDILAAPEERIKLKPK
jgi:ribonuclease P protein subunit POP4